MVVVGSNKTKYTKMNFMRTFRKLDVNNSRLEIQFEPDI